jgi:hypothetical protein
VCHLNAGAIPSPPKTVQRRAEQRAAERLETSSRLGAASPFLILILILILIVAALLRLGLKPCKMDAVSQASGPKPREFRPSQPLAKFTLGLALLTSNDDGDDDDDGERTATGRHQIARQHKQQNTNIVSAIPPPSPSFPQTERPNRHFSLSGADDEGASGGTDGENREGG